MKKKYIKPYSERHDLYEIIPLAAGSKTGASDAGYREGTDLNGGDQLGAKGNNLWEDEDLPYEE
jgi:hypothetical protein